MVASAVSVFHLMGIRAVCQRHQLMSQTDREDRHIRLIQLFDLFNDRRTFLRISRAVGKHDSIRLIRQDLLRACQCRINRNLASSLIQRTCDVVLCSQIQKGYFVTVPFQHALFAAGYFFYYFSGIICF